MDMPDRTRSLRVALIHHWLVSMRGGERVLEALCDIFPDAEIFTHVHDPDRLSPALRRRTVHTSFIQRLPFARRWYRFYLPLMPIALEQFDLQGFDLVVSSDAGPVKGVLTHPEALHICYCHTPMRYIWGMQGEYIGSFNPLAAAAFAAIAHYLRLWDVAAAARVDHFVANSRSVARRIRKWYRADAPVIWPPVDCAAFRHAEPRSDFYLVVGQLVAYKRAELAVLACNLLGRKLVVIGEGEQLGPIRKLAGPTVSVLGAQPFDVVRDHFARCRALLFPGEEDFGIVPVEAMAAGRPVIALRRGGALDTVRENVTGVFFDEPTAAALAGAITRFEAVEAAFDPEAIVRHAWRFDKSRFDSAFRAFVDRCLADRRSQNPDDAQAG